MKKLLLILLCLPFIGFGQVLAPSLVSSSGNTFSSGNVIMDFSLGEVVITTHLNSSNILTQGFHQEILKVTTQVVNIDIKTKVFPNPTTSSLTIELGYTIPYTAADVCANLTLDGYSDWFLPSRMELVEMHQNIGQGNALGLGNIGGFSNSYYWSSTEAFGSSTAWVKYFRNTTSGVNYWYKDELEYVRAIRAF